MHDTTIGFIGAGNMASALVKGLISTGLRAEQLLVSDRDGAKCEELRRGCGLRVAPDNQALVDEAEVVVLAVKPQGLREVLGEIRDRLARQPRLLISIAAGITLPSLQAWSAPDQAIVRCMPNTPALVGAGASGLYANEQAGEQQRRLAGDILAAVGTVCWVESEAELDAVTALSGSGPAYFFLLMEAMQEAGEALGLDRDTAARLCLQTAFGAARLALESDVGVDELRRRVTSPGGTTEAALRQFDAEGFRDIVGRALDKAAARSRELARQLANS